MKNCTTAPLWREKLFRIMKLTSFLLFCVIMQVAASSYSQKARLQINMKNAEVKDVLEEIKKQSEFDFLYKSDLIKSLPRVTVEVREVQVTEILDQIIPDDLEYEIFDRNIIIRKNPHPAVKPVEIEEDDVDISGKITDENGEGLPGASVIEKGTSNGTTTDLDGNYKLGLDEEATLVVSFVGYKTTEVAIAGRSTIDIQMELDAEQLEEIVVIGYGTQKKSDLTGSVTRVKGEDFQTQSMVQLTDMLTGTIAGLNTNQSTLAQGGASLEIRGPTSLSAGTSPLIVLDGVIFNGSLLDINPYDIESIDILKDASSAAVFGSKAASGVIIVTTNRGKKGETVINFSTKLGVAQSYNDRRGLNPEQYIRFRQDFLRQVSTGTDYDFYTNPNELPSNVSIQQWRDLNTGTPLSDDTREWMGRLQLFPIEQENYLAGKTMDMYDEVFRVGFRQEYNFSISSGTEKASYYWSIGYNDNEGIRLGDRYSSVRSRLNADIEVNNWFNVGINTQFSTRDESSVPASLDFYANSPYGQMFDADGNLMRMPHGHTDNPLLDYYRNSVLDKTNSLFASMYAQVKLPLGIKFKVSFQPRYEAYKYLSFTTISDELGGFPNEESRGRRSESSTMAWMVDNLLTWNKEIGQHSFDVTLLANVEENQYWSTSQSNKNFSPNQQLGYHGLQFGDAPEINNDDFRSTGDALMARINYTLKDKYLFTASARRDGYSAFGLKNPRAFFPSMAVGWVISEESFFKGEFIDRMKLRGSWGANGNRNIGIYSALARTGSSLWYDGTNTRVGVSNSTLANDDLKWEKTTSVNFGMDVAILENRINLTADYYVMTTTDLLMDRVLPRVTGFSNIVSNLGELGNRGFEMTIDSWNIHKANFSWKSNLAFSFNRNEIKELFGDFGTYTLLGEERVGDVPDFSNQWFPGEALDVVWDYDVIGIWQTDEAAKAAEYNMQPGDFKAVDVDNDGRYVNLQDKRFIGYTAPRFRLGLRNDFSFLKNFTASLFIRSDIGHVGEYSDALNEGFESNDRRSRINGPVPYWTTENQNNEYARLDVNTGAYGGGLMIYKPRTFVRIQDISLTYNVPSSAAQLLRLNSLQVYGSVRNLATFTKWPGWDPESEMNPMPRTITLGLNCSF